MVKNWYVSEIESVYNNLIQTVDTCSIYIENYRKNVFVFFKKVWKI